MPMGTEDERVGMSITTQREPKGPTKSGGKGTVGDQALMDALLLIVVCWLLVFALGFSLRVHNI